MIQPVRVCLGRASRCLPAKTIATRLGRT
jgi:hypothetical protein